MDEKLSVHKAVCPSGKVVLLRPMMVRYEDLALQAVGKRGGDNHNLSQKLAMDEILKLLIVAIDDQRPDQIKLEKLDNLFEYQDVLFLRKCVMRLMGQEAGEEKPLVLELVSFSGGK